MKNSSLFNVLKAALLVSVLLTAGLNNYVVAQDSGIPIAGGGRSDGGGAMGTGTVSSSGIPIAGGGRSDGGGGMGSGNASSSSTPITGDESDIIVWFVSAVQSFFD